MEAWQFITICGIIFVLLELFVPSMFFLNFAVAAFLTAVVSLYIAKTIWLVVIFCILSFISFIFLRPLIAKKSDKEFETGINDKYIGKTATVTEEISSNSGSISLYDERWTARTEDGSVIPVGEEVKIIKNDSLIMFVEKI